jgi:hypothetical protein
MHAPRQAQWPQAQELNMFAAAHFERTQLGSEAKTRQVRSTADSRRGDDHRTCSAKGQKQPSYLFVGQSHSAPVSDILPMGETPITPCWGLTLRRFQKRLTFIPYLALKRDGIWLNHHRPLAF